MTAEKAFYKSLGHELMKELAGSFFGSELISGDALGAYEVLTLPNGMSVRFTNWRWGEVPFYIILFKDTQYVFELDLSMIVHREGRFTWHLKTPSNTNNLTFLDNWLGEAEQLSNDYRELVKNVKRTLHSGITTPSKGYQFIENSEWFEVCDSFLNLMRRAIKTHSSDANSSQPFTEAEDDADSDVIDTKRKARRSQSRFRLNMMELYGSACAISGESVVEVLEAAHIWGHAETGINHTGNGLLLRSDLHRLFDSSLIAIEPTSLKIAVSKSLADTSYKTLSGMKLRPRINGETPDQTYLEIKWQQANLKNNSNWQIDLANI